MRQILAGAALVAFLLLTWNARTAAQPAQNTPPKKAGTAPKKTGTAVKPAAKKANAAAKKTPARKSTGGAARSTNRTTTARNGGKKAPPRPAAWRTRQTAPTPDRYRQIQQALVTKGYLKPEDANGVWNQNSMDALKRFQAEQNIESTGKINSLSLIALGLGPKHETDPAKPPAPAQPPVPDAASGRM